MFHVIFRLCFLLFIKLLNVFFILLYKLNFRIRFSGFSESFTKCILLPIFQGFSPLWQRFLQLCCFPFFVMSFYRFSFVFYSYVNRIKTLFSFSWHNIVYSKLFILFVKLRLVFVSFSSFSLNFCIVSFPFFAYNKLNTTFRTNFSPWGAPERSFIILWNTAKDWSL